MPLQRRGRLVRASRDPPWVQGPGGPVSTCSGAGEPRLALYKSDAVCTPPLHGHSERQTRGFHPPQGGRLCPYPAGIKLLASSGSHTAAEAKAGDRVLKCLSTAGASHVPAKKPRVFSRLCCPGGCPGGCSAAHRCAVGRERHRARRKPPQNKRMNACS